jgi:tetratricopeptide (TPR) repeat protein
LEGAFRNLIEVGRFLPESRLIDMEKLIDRGLNWLLSIGKRHWSAGLYLQRATLRKEQERYEEALAEMELALSLCYRYSDAPGYTLGTHLLCLGDLLNDMGRMDEAEQYYLNVAGEDSFDVHDQWRAWQGLSEVSLNMEILSKLKLLL